MRSKRSTNYSALFRIFEYDKPDKTGAILRKIGIISFNAGYLVAFSMMVFKDSTLNLLGGLVFAAWTLGIFMFIATGIHYSDRAVGKSFVTKMLKVFRNAFLYLFLPATVLTIILIAWAIITKQPAFR